MTTREATPCERCGLWCAWSEWKDVTSRAPLRWGHGGPDTISKTARYVVCRRSPEFAIVEMRVVAAPAIDSISITTTFEAA